MPAELFPYLAERIVVVVAFGTAGRGLRTWISSQLVRSSIALQLLDGRVYFFAPRREASSMDGFKACSSLSTARLQPLRKTRSVRSTLAAPARRFLQGFLRWWQLEMLRGIRRRIAAAVAVTPRWLKAEDVAA